MGIGLIAVAGVLLLGAGIVILVSNLGKARGSIARAGTASAPSTDPDQTLAGRLTVVSGSRLPG